MPLSVFQSVKLRVNKEEKIFMLPNKAMAKEGL